MVITDLAIVGPIRSIHPEGRPGAASCRHVCYVGNNESVGVIEVSNHAHARSSRSTFGIRAYVIGSDVDIIRVSSEIAILQSDRLIHVLDMAIGFVVRLLRLAEDVEKI